MYRMKSLNLVHFEGLIKTFTENQGSKRHLLELSWPIQRLRLKLFIFLGIKLFCFSKQKAETFSICLKKNFINLTKFQRNQTTDRKNGNKKFLNELNKLKFCQVLGIHFQTDANFNYNCYNLLDKRNNLQEQVKKAFCYQKLF